MKRIKGHVPVRTCISCRKKRGKKELIRLILDGNGLVARDDDDKGQGRGAYICPNRSCLEILKKGKNVSRAFRRTGPLAFHPDLWVE